MIKMPKFVYYIIAVVILLVCATFCVMAIINNDTASLVSNITLTVTSIVGLLVKSDNDDNGKDDKGDDDKNKE